MNSPTKQKNVVIRFAGDSGDGMQLTGNQFTRTSSLLGNDTATYPDYPAEIRWAEDGRVGMEFLTPVNPRLYDAMMALIPPRQTVW